MAFQRSRQNLGPLNAETNAIVFNSGKGCLGNARDRGELVLTQLLKLTKDAHRFPNRDGNTFFRRAIFFHLLTVSK